MSLLPLDTEGLHQHHVQVMTPASCPTHTEQIPEGSSTKEGPRSTAEPEVILAPSRDIWQAQAAAGPAKHSPPRCWLSRAKRLNTNSSAAQIQSLAVI